MTTERIIEAERRIELSIGKLVDIEVIAGAPEKRRSLEALRTRWNEEAVPFLEKAGAASLRDLEARLPLVTALQATASEERAKAQTAKVEAEALRSRVALLARQAPESKEELHAKESRIGALPRDVLAKFFASMGPTWETQCEGLRGAKTKALQGLRDSVSQIEGKQKEADWNVQEAKKREAEAGVELPPLLEGLGGEPLAVQTKVAVELQANSTATKQLEAAMRTERHGRSRWRSAPDARRRLRVPIHPAFGSHAAG